MIINDSLENYTPSATRYEASELFYNRCGRSGVMLPKVSLGLWHNFGQANDFDTCRSILRYAFDNGIVHFDLANNYGPPKGYAEQTFGKILQSDFKPFRDEMFIATKAGYEMWEGPYGNWGSRKHIISSLDQSLSRMKLDYVDLFYSHRYDPNTPIEETLNALVDVVKQGKTLYIGISRWPLEQLKQAYNYLAEHDVKVLTVQDRLNLLDRKPQNEGILSFCREVGAGFVSFSPLAQGLLTNKYLNGVPAHSRMEQNLFLQKKVLTPELLAYLKHLNTLASDRQESLAEMALAWVLAQKGVTSVIIGASSVEQLVQNIKCVNAAPFVEEL